VIPEGFTGAFVLISCADYPDHIEKLSDRYRLSIPADGVFRTRDTSIFSKWHTGSAIFANTRTPAPLIAAHSGGFGDKRKTPCVWSWYYIGDAKSKGEFFNTPGKDQEWLRARGIDPFGGPAAP
jgi:hypothetical protein